MNENVNICITPKGDKPVLHFSQFDNERVFTVTVLADDGESAAVLTGLDIEFRIRKTDSHVVTIAPESVADNVITFKTTKQLCACCGQNIASVVLMKDDMVISTLDILVDIQRDILSGGLTSESDIRNLTTQIEQIVPEVVGDDYYTKTEVDELIDDIPTFDPTNYYDKSAVDGLLADKADSDDVYTKTETDNLLADKADNSDIPDSINDLSDVNTAGAVNGNALIYNNGTWVPGSGGGGVGIQYSEYSSTEEITLNTSYTTLETLNLSAGYYIINAFLWGSTNYQKWLKITTDDTDDSSKESQFCPLGSSSALYGLNTTRLLYLTSNTTVYIMGKTSNSSRTGNYKIEVFKFS